MGAPEPDPLLDNVRATLQHFSMMPDEGRMLVACSAGADSVCLAHALHALGVPIALAHLDHNLRGNEGAADAALVESLAQALNAPFHSGRIDGDLRQVEGSMEMAARDARYGFLVQVANAHNYGVIATAHHADDNVETVLMRIVRGTSSRGLAGIPPVGQHHGMRVVRPLIECSRSLIREWIDARGIAFREDETNTDTNILRNRVRHELIPMLERDYNPNARNAIARLSALVSEDDQLLTAAASDVAPNVFDSEGMVRRRRFIPVPPPLQRRLITAWIEGRGVEATFERVEMARQHIMTADTGKWLTLSDTVAIENTRIRARIIDPSAPPPPVAEEVTLKTPGTTKVLGKTFAVTYEDVPEPPYDQHCSPTVQLLDADKMGHALAVRTWNDGDRIAPLGMNGSKKLQDWFTDKGVPQSDRAQMPLILAGNQIAWIPGGPIAAPFAITRDTRQALRIEMTDI